MANYCIFCGEEIPEYKATCNLCCSLVESLPPDRAKKLQKALENEEARMKYQAGIMEIKLRLRIAISPVVDAIIDFIDTALAAMEEDGDGNGCNQVHH